MFAVACILHSQNGQFAPSLVANAASCVTALFQSVLAAAPDFVPTFAVLRTDPTRGTRFLYSASLPDSNHAVPQAHVFAAAAPTIGAQEVTGAFLGRSAAVVVESLLTGTQPEVAGDAATLSSSDPWNCLAGALLTALCFLHRHEVHVGGAEDGAATTTDPALSPLPLKCRSVVLVFSDCVDTAPVSFVADCAFSVAAVALARAEVTMSCFGQAAALAALAVVNSEASVHDARPDPSVGGAARLRALTASLDGVCAAHFVFAHLPLILASVGAVDAGQAGEDEGAALQRRRSRRARMMEQYVVTPTMLPQRPDKLARASRGVAPPQLLAGLGWLCPRCMAIVQWREEGESVQGAANQPGYDGEEEDDDEEENEVELGITCPYCDLDS